jgi:hypothetical protein
VWKRGGDELRFKKRRNRPKRDRKELRKFFPVVFSGVVKKGRASKQTGIVETGRISASLSFEATGTPTF